MYFENNSPSTSASERVFHDVVGMIVPGRFSVTCIEAKNLRRKDRTKEKTVLNPLVRLTLGPENSKFVLSSKCYSGVSHSPSFNNEVLSFDIQIPNEVICFRAKDIKLKIEVIDSSPLESFCMGEVTISAMRYFQGKTQSEMIPLYQKDDESTNSSIHLQFNYLPVKEGILELSMLKCINLRELQINPNLACTPYITFSIGGFKRQMSLINNKTKSLSFPSNKDREYLDLNKKNWFQPMIIKVISTSSQDVLFEQSIELLQIVNKDEDSPPESIKVVMDESSDQIVGSLTFMVKFFQSSVMNISLKSAKSLLEIDSSQQQINPYVVIKTQGRSSCPQFRSRTIHEGGMHPTWDEKVDFIVVDHYELIVECYNDDFVSGSHDLIGSGQLSLIPAYRTGHISTWISLTRKNEVGAILKSGQINVLIYFEADGSKYPLFHQSNAPMKWKKTDSKTFDDDIVSASVPKGFSKDVKRKGEDFTDEDIQSTFSLLDLDRNGYVGSAELRHVLINMGELITDEEVDTMISMLDNNGDGQVNYKQFEAMARCSDIHNMETSLQATSKLKSPKDSLMIQSVDTEHRQLFSKFIQTNEIGRNDVTNLSSLFIKDHRNFVSNKGSSVDSEDYRAVYSIDYKAFIDILPIQDTGESRRIFDIFDDDQNGFIDIRVLALSLCSYIKTYSVEDKCSLIVELFDNAENGVDTKYLKVILAGTHLKSQHEVTRKTQTILSYFRDSNHLSKEQLQTAATKFPNLFLPSFV